MKRREPIFNITEPTLFAFLGALIAIHLVRQLPEIGPAIDKNALLFPFGAEADNGRQAFRLIAHGFLHGDGFHLLMNSAMILIFGLLTLKGTRAKFRNQTIAVAAFLAIILVGIVGGGVAQWAEWEWQNSFGVMLGASGGASALFAAAGWAIGGWRHLGIFAAAWAMLNVVMVLFSGTIGNISWAGHLGGFVAGALIAPLCVQAFSARKPD